MRRLALVVLLVLGLLASSAVAATPTGSYGTVRGVVAFVGDSNINHGAAELANTLTPSVIGYIPVLESAGSASIRWNGCKVVPAGQPCPDPTYSDYWATRLPAAQAHIQPDIYVVELGVNDTRIPGTFTGQGYSNYSAKIDWLLALIPATVPVIWTTLPCTLEPADRYTGCVAVNYGILAAPKRHPNLTVANWAAAANPHPEYMIAGDVHYTPAGYAAWSALVVAVLGTRLP